MKHRTILDEFLRSLRKSGDHNQNVEVKPAVILWTDEHRAWTPLLPKLRGLLPGLLTLGKWQPAARTGPAYWIKCVIARALPDVTLPDDDIPIIYLPGVSRATLRQVNICPPDLQPLAELQFRGSFWTQVNGKDWTPYAFLTSAHGGLGLDVAADAETKQALLHALPQVVSEQVVRFEGKRVDHEEIARLLDVDLARDLLVWMDSTDAMPASWDAAYLEAVRTQAVKRLKFDPVKDDRLSAAEQLAARHAEWKAIWQRYCESPIQHPGVTKLLDQLPPPTDMFADKEPYPQANQVAEEKLQKELAAFGGITHVVPARERLLELEKEHGLRRQWVWSALGRAPLATALGHLVRIADLSQQNHCGATPADMRARYEEEAWEIDAAMIDALAAAKTDAQTRAVEVALTSVYKPWLETHAEKFQAAVKQHDYPLEFPPQPTKLEPGLVVFFVDGLRYEAGRRLSRLLAHRNYQTTLESAWTAIPSVTASGKVLSSPAAIMAIGDAGDEDFAPQHKAKKRPLNAQLLRKTLQEMGWQTLEKDEVGNPDGTAWVESGDLDHYGHDNQLRLAKDLGKQIDSVLERIEQLLAAGWKRVRVVTDHGWLLVPGKLDKIQLEKDLTETTWGRAAKLKPGSMPTPLTFPWTWCDAVQIALAPGAKSFKAGEHYSHGGLSIQESLMPVIEVTGTASGPTAKVISKKWVGLRLRLQVETNGKVIADLRQKAGSPDTSIARTAEEVVHGEVSLTVEDDGLVGSTAFVVLLGPGGQLLDKQMVEIGG
jgi:hypothetical protein